MSIQPRSRTRSWVILAASGAIALMLVCGALALMLRSGNAPIAMVPQQQIEQQAAQFAQNQFAGTVTTVAARATTQGEMNPQRCSVIRWLGQQMSVIAGTWEWNHCSDDLPMWQVMLQGEFRNHEGNLFRSLQLGLMPDGSPSIMIEGPAEER